MLQLSRYYDRERPPVQRLLKEDIVTFPKADVNTFVDVLDIIHFDDVESVISLSLLALH